MKPSNDIPAANARASAATATLGDPVPAPLVKPRKDFPRVLARFDKAIARLPAGLALHVGPTALSPAEIRADLAPLLGLYLQLNALVAQTQKLRLQIEALTPATYQRVKSIKVALVNALGAGHPQLSAFGIPAPKRRPLTVQEKFLKVQRSKRTRKVRNTLGPRQRQKVKFQGELQAAVQVAAGPDAAEAPD
jgi:hypothetical protein